MRDLYRKRGRSVRWENGTLVFVNESGVAVESDALFTCHPDPELAASNGSSLDAAEVESTARAIRMPQGVRIERLIVSEGEAEHTFRDRTWSDRQRRIHLAVAKAHLRVLIDLADFDLAGIDTIAEALARAEEPEREPPERLRLAPNVTAALLPALGGTQRAGGIDGYGNAIDDANEPWPNWYRPSYRVRPVRMPFNLTADADAAGIDESLPLAVALLGPSRLLIVDGARVYPSTVQLTRITAVGAPERWYPYGAGVWGAPAML